VHKLFIVFLLGFVFAANIPSRPDIRPFDDKATKFRITGTFGEQRDGRKHQGIDYAMLTGTPVIATADGIVTSAKWFNGYGMTIIINHGEGIETLYAHLDEFTKLKGAVVKKGDVIGYSGHSGNVPPHLHYELRENGIAVWNGKYQRIRAIEEGRIKP